MATKDNQPSIAKVDKPGEEAQVRSLEETLAIEARVAEDQIPDYHKTHPTLDTSGPEHDPEVQQALIQQAIKAAGPSKKEIAAQVEEITT
jgi:hypothetical protein